MAEVVSMVEAIDTSKGGGMIPMDQPRGLGCLSCFRPRRGPWILDRIWVSRRGGVVEIFWMQIEC
jgi:hypothetical protein